VQIYVFSDKGSDAVSDLSVVTSTTVEEAVAEVLVSLAASVRSGYDSGCGSDAFGSVQVCPAASPPPPACPRRLLAHTSRLHVQLQLHLTSACPGPAHGVVWVLGAARAIPRETLTGHTWLGDSRLTRRGHANRVNPIA